MCGSEFISIYLHELALFDFDHEQLAVERAVGPEGRRSAERRQVGTARELVADRAAGCRAPRHGFEHQAGGIVCLRGEARWVRLMPQPVPDDEIVDRLIGAV